jgi:hypothetical protein
MSSVIHKTVLLIFTLTLVAGLWAASPERALACSCMMPGTPAQEMDRSVAVFAGRVVSINAPVGIVISSADPVVITFDVSQVWKGPEEATIRLTTARDSASCGYEFTTGQEYIVYAYHSEEGLSTGLCTRTNRLENAADDLAALGQGVVPQPAATELGARATWLLWLVAGGSLVTALGLASAIFLLSRRGR